MNTSIAFPNLGIELEHVGKNFHIFGFEIAYYGVVLAIAMVSGIAITMHMAKKTGQDPEPYFDIGLIGIFFALIGARIYYVAFSWDYYKDHLLSIFNYREGGLAIYGGVIAACAAIMVYAKIKKRNVFQLFDTACIGLVLGQIIGRWGNFFNREAFGGYTNNILAMRLPVDAVRSSEITQQMTNNMQNIGGVNYIQVHPTFLYESLWNIGVLIILLWYTNRKKFQGEVFMLYLLGYGLGRAWIESLRTDQLIILGVGLPVSQILAMILVCLSIGGLLIKRKIFKRVEGTGEEHGPDGGFKDKD